MSITVGQRAARSLTLTAEHVGAVLGTAGDDRVIDLRTAYVMPGFDLARAVAALWAKESTDDTEGLVLLHHGLFTFGATTRAAYARHVALITLLIAVLAAGITSTFRNSVEELWATTDYAVTAQNNFSPLPSSVADAVAAAPGVEAVGNVRTGEAQAFGDTFFATAVNPETRDMFSIDWNEGSQQVVAALDGQVHVRDAPGELRARRRSRARRLEKPGVVADVQTKSSLGFWNLPKALRWLRSRLKVLTAPTM